MAGGKVMQYYGARKEAEAASNAMRDQWNTANAQKAELMGQVNKNNQQNMDFAKASPQELRAYEASLGSAEKQNTIDQQLVDAINPSVMEASKQVLGILRGDTSSGAMGPYAQQRDQQRQQVINQLRQKFGPGGETTSAGQKALRDFDLSANMQGAQLGQQQLGSLYNVINGRPTMANSENMLNAAGGNFSMLQNRMLNTSVNNGNALTAAMSGANAPILQSSGYANIGGQLMGRNQQQIGREWSQDSAQFMGIMGSAMTGSSGGGGKGAPQMDSSAMSGGGGSGGGDYFKQSNPYSGEGGSFGARPSGGW